jgi:hypothetical protein
MDGKRSFTLVAVGDIHGKAKGKKNIGGRFVSSTPAGAARKAFARVCRESAIRGQCTLMVTIQETTRGSKGKMYHYKGKRMVQDRTVMRDGVKVNYHYTTKVTKHVM